MKVKVLKCDNAWYKNDIGNIFEVSEKTVMFDNNTSNDLCYQVITNGKITRALIKVEDTEII